MNKESRFFKLLGMLMCMVLLIGGIVTLAYEPVNAGQTGTLSYTVNADSGSNHFQLSVVCTNGDLNSAWGWTEVGYSVSGRCEGAMAYFDVYAPEGQTFTSSFTLYYAYQWNFDGDANTFVNPPVYYQAATPTTAAPTTRATTAAPTTRATTAAPTTRTTTRSSANNTPTPTPHSATPAPQQTTAAGGNSNTATPTPTSSNGNSGATPTTAAPGAAATEVAAGADQTTVTTVAADADEATDETIVDEEVVGDGEEAIPVDENAAETISEEEAEAMVANGEATPTPTSAPRAAGFIRRAKPGEDNKGGGFPWWIILLILLGAGGYRYYKLNQDYTKTNKDILYEFIPGGIVGKVIEKVHPSPTTSTPTPQEDAPEVVNGYLKTSNTKSIRPVYSNAPSSRPAPGSRTTAGARPTTGTRTTAATRTTTAKAAPMTTNTPDSTNKVPLQQRPPIKRPTSLSVNRAAASAVNTEATTKAAPTVSASATAAVAATTSSTTASEKSSVATPTPTIQRPTSPLAARAAASAASTTASAAPRTAASTTSTTAPASAPASKKIPLQQRPPIKRPASLSSNRAAAMAATTVAAKKEETADAKEAPVQQRAPIKRPPRANNKTPDTMNRPDGTALNVNATPTAAAQAFEKAQAENKVTPSIATRPVPPVIEKKVEEPKISPFKSNGVPAPVTRSPGIAGAAAIKTEEVKSEGEAKKPMTADSYFIPMKKAATEEVNPFKSNVSTGTPDNGLKAPIKRPASASVNRVAAMKAEEAASEAKADSSSRMGITEALAKDTLHTTFKATAYAEKKEIDPFKRPAQTDAPKKPFNAAAAMKELRQMEEAESNAPASTPAPTPTENKGALGGLFDKFKR